MDLFPPIEPHAQGMLDVGDGHSLYWEASGNPLGPAILFVHGGPGAGSSPVFRRFFDPAHWRIILFDQRGCGRSRPLACIEANTTAHLIADMEALRRHLSVESWVLFGGSWGSTLALAYGQAHPQRVRAFVLRGVFLFRPFEVEWFLSGMGTFFPEAHARFAAHVRGDEGDLLSAYYRRLTNPDPAAHLPAAEIWCGYEDSCARLLPNSGAGRADALALLAMARIECHYMVHGGFLAPNQLLDHMERIQHIPAFVVQGRYDVICPPVTAVELARSWPGCRLEMASDAGHASLEPGIRVALVQAVRELARRG